MGLQPEPKGANSSPFKILQWHGGGNSERGKHANPTVMRFSIQLKILIRELKKIIKIEVKTEITFLTHSLTNPKKRSFLFFLLKLKKIYSFIFLNVWLTFNCVRYASLVSFNLFKGVAEKWN